MDVHINNYGNSNTDPGEGRTWVIFLYNNDKLEINIVALVTGL